VAAFAGLPENLPHSIHKGFTPTPEKDLTGFRRTLINLRDCDSRNPNRLMTR